MTRICDTLAGLRGCNESTARAAALQESAALLAELQMTARENATSSMLGRSTMPQLLGQGVQELVHNLCTVIGCS